MKKNEFLLGKESAPSLPGQGRRRKTWRDVKKTAQLYGQRLRNGRSSVFMIIFSLSMSTHDSKRSRGRGRHWIREKV